MKYLQNRLVNEFFDRTEVKATQYKKTMLAIALFPTLLMSAYIFLINDTIETPLLILLGFALVSVYLVSVGATILAVDCWIIAEMISPNVKGRYKKLRTFIQIVTNSPTRQEVLRVTKLFADIVEKNGIENYQSTSEFMKNFYDNQESQNRKIESLQKQINTCNENDERVIPHIARHNKSDYDFSYRLKNLEETISEIKQILLNKKPVNTISLEEYNILYTQLLKAEEELRKLKGE